uniref:Uncharacterized protein n=1 Tax=Lepeophtheirus salmonis TaxID=72036 RepID=A0A0K2UNV3_LEPSM
MIIVNYILGRYHVIVDLGRVVFGASTSVHSHNQRNCHERLHSIWQNTPRPSGCASGQLVPKEDQSQLPPLSCLLKTPSNI